MKRTAHRQRARESIAQMILKIERLENARRSGQPRISQRFKGIFRYLLRVVTITRPNGRVHY